jgi:Zn-dependent protease with chaperone function
MLNAALRFSAVAALCAVAAAFTIGEAHAEKAPPKKRWEELRDKPIDYAPYERRRAENLKAVGTSAIGAFAGGYAKASDLNLGPNTQQVWVITDEALTNGLTEQAKALLPETMGIKPPPMQFVVIDDLGLYAEARAMGAGNPGIDVLLKRPEVNFTARATGGGAVVLGLSVLKAVKTYDELAFVLGHESSHILYDHHTEEETQQTIGEVIAVGTLIAAIATQRSDQNTRENVAWSAIGLMVAYSLLGPAWDRGQERESDQLGYELLLESGRSAEGATNIFDKLAAQEKAWQEYLDVMCGKDSAGERFFKGLLGAALGVQIPEQGYAPHSPVCAERRNLFASLFRSHPKIEDRREELAKHNKKFYPDMPPRPVTSIGNGQVTLLEFLSPNGDATRLSKAYDGLNAFHANDLATARAIALQLKPDKSEVRIPVLELCFRVAKVDGNRPEALRCLEQALIAPQAVQYMFVIAEQEYMGLGRWADAARVLELGVRKGIYARDQILVKLIAYLRAAGDFARMEIVLIECKALERSGMTLACEAVAHPPQTMMPPGVPPPMSPPPSMPAPPPPASAPPTP